MQSQSTDHGNFRGDLRCTNKNFAGAHKQKPTKRPKVQSGILERKEDVFLSYYAYLVRCVGELFYIFILTRCITYIQSLLLVIDLFK